MTKLSANQRATANRRPALQSDGSDGLVAERKRGRNSFDEGPRRGDLPESLA